MTDIKYYIFEEHSSQINKNESANLSEVLENSVSECNFSPDNVQYLGINDKFVANYFIGMRWIDWQTKNSKSKGVIWVKPKHKKIPFESLLWKCLKHPIVCKHLDKCYNIFPNEPPIPISDDFSDFITPLMITDFIVRVQDIAKKGLKKCFVSIEEILKNKIKGKIHINMTIKNHLKKTTINQAHCTYQIHSSNCIENKILKAALIQSSKYITRFMADRESIKNILHYNLMAFEEVELATINTYDINTINHSSFYKEYKPAITLAKVILKCFGYSLNSDISVKNKTIPPFYINMPELFERYCEVLLWNKYKDILVGYHETGPSETRLGKSKLRPDFIIPLLNMIVDSKYKYWIDSDDDLEGMKQLSLYSRHTKALEKLNKNNQQPLLQIIYPCNNGEHEIDFQNKNNHKIDEYFEIYKYPLSIL